VKAIAIENLLGMAIFAIIGVLVLSQLDQGIAQIFSGVQKTTVTNDNVETIQKEIEGKCEIETKSAGEGPYNTPDLSIDRIEAVETEAVTEDGSFSRTNITYNLLSSQQVKETSCRIDGGEITFTRQQDYKVEISCSDCAAEPPVLEISKKDDGGD
jgi:hypothetical protein